MKTMMMIIIISIIIIIHLGDCLTTLENNDNDDSCNDNNNINEGCHGDSDKNDDNLLQIFYLTNVIFVLVF